MKKLDEWVVHTFSSSFVHTYKFAMSESGQPVPLPNSFTCAASTTRT